MATPYKMKGSPMQRNFGISPMKKDEKTSTKEKAKAVIGTISDVLKSSEPITAMTNVKRTYKENKAYQRALSTKKSQE
tara:strand:- start:55 stop:288 length:234 start_codon:yes stop_codon:yes gene_type:complete